MCLALKNKMGLCILITEHFTTWHMTKSSSQFEISLLYQIGMIKLHLEYLFFLMASTAATPSIPGRPPLEPGSPLRESAFFFHCAALASY